MTDDPKSTRQQFFEAIVGEAKPASGPLPSDDPKSGRQQLFDALMGGFIVDRGGDVFRARYDFAFFIERTFLDQRGRPIHLKSFHVEMIKNLLFDRRVMNLIPRGWGKSMTSTVWYPSWRLGNNRDLRIIIASNTITQAKWWLSEIENVMFKNQQYIETFGYLVPRPRSLRWTDTEKVVLGRSPHATHSSLLATGVGSALLGARSDIVCIDDIVGETEAKSPVMAQAASDWFWKVLMPTLEPDGQVVVSGSRWARNDLYQEIMDRWAGLPSDMAAWQKESIRGQARYPSRDELLIMDNKGQLDPFEETPHPPLRQAAP